MTPFAIDVTDVTVAAYGACVAAGRCTPPGSTGDAGRDVACNWGKPGREGHPVNCVTWYDANAYCLWMGKRLPTANEWTWAAGGGARTYPWGNEPPSNQLCWQRPLGADSSCPAGAFPGGATPEGVRDLEGNMAQWTATDPDGTGQKRVTKGAFWGALPANSQWLAVTFSGLALVGARANGQSFRCVR
jgi:formylglycine-generating enzyme required for sulfatase activity